MKFLAAFMSVLPGILKAVVDIQSLVGNSMPGASKKQLIMDATSIAAKVGETVPEAHIAGWSAYIDQTVATFKASGIFAADGTVKTVPALPAGASSTAA